MSFSSNGRKLAEAKAKIPVLRVWPCENGLYFVGFWVLVWTNTN